MGGAGGVRGGDGPGGAEAAADPRAVDADGRDEVRCRGARGGGRGASRGGGGKEEIWGGADEPSRFMRESFIAYGHSTAFSSGRGTAHTSRIRRAANRVQRLPFVHP